MPASSALLLLCQRITARAEEWAQASRRGEARFTQLVNTKMELLYYLLSLMCSRVLAWLQVVMVVGCACQVPRGAPILGEHAPRGELATGGQAARALHPLPPLVA